MREFWVWGKPSRSTKIVDFGPAAPNWTGLPLFFKECIPKTRPVPRRVRQCQEQKRQNAQPGIVTVNGNEDILRVGIPRDIEDDPQDEHAFPEPAWPQRPLENVQCQGKPMEDSDDDLQDGEDINNGKIPIEGVDDLKIQMFGRAGSENAVRPARGQHDREGEIKFPCSSDIGGHDIHYA